jgi:hypothetical protein
VSRKPIGPKRRLAAIRAKKTTSGRNPSGLPRMRGVSQKPSIP